MLSIVLVTLLQQSSALIFVFTEYTHVAETFSGQPCLTGCDANFECYINWKWEKQNCRTFEIAPIYLTSRIKDPPRKYCLSNCGYFGENYEWCITTEDLKWDYCSTYRSTTFLPSLQPVARTRLGDICIDDCRYNGYDLYYWCHFNKETWVEWEYCAPPPLPRVPVLRDDFRIGPKNKGNCDGFLKYVSGFRSNLSGVDAADNHVRDLADAIDGTAILPNNPLTKLFKVTDRKPIESYTMISIRNISVPAVIRAHITKESVNIRDESRIPESFIRKIREQLHDTTDSFGDIRLIGGHIGGPKTEYNIVPRSVDWQWDEWWDLERVIRDWCLKTDGAVDMIVVVFYRDNNTPIPRAFGVSLVYRNDDNSVFVDCRDKIHYNYF